jgi:hypothetical protein
MRLPAFLLRVRHLALQASATCSGKNLLGAVVARRILPV